jgi:hypothetical protein
MSVTVTIKTNSTMVTLPNGCSAASGSCAQTNATTYTWTGTLLAGQILRINYTLQVADNVQPATQLCVTTDAVFNAGLSVTVQACTTANCPAVGPGQTPDATSPVSDQRGGSVLFYNVYTSNVSAPNGQNTRINITNTHPSLTAYVHLFFVDGSTCSVSDNYLCLTPNQTTSFLMSDVDPGITGYLVAVAIDRDGCPTNFNYLIGDEFVKFASGHEANLSAEAITALAGGLPPCDEKATTATLKFDGVSYSPLPRALAASNIPSGADGNDTMLILNRIGGDLLGSAATLTGIFGLLYDDTENGVSFGFNPALCQFRSSITNSFPRTAPRFEQFIPAGRSGWMKLYSQNDQAILGAMINFNQNAAAGAGYNQGHNMHKLTLTQSATLIIPVFPPSCQ